MASAPGPQKPGLSATAYPTGVAAVPVEVVESTAPLLFLRKELRPDSGGDGRASTAASGRSSSSPSTTAGTGRSTRSRAGSSHPPLGLFGGERGAVGPFTVNGEPVRTQKRIDLHSGDVVRLELPGGGGYGHVHEAATGDGSGPIRVSVGAARHRGRLVRSDPDPAREPRPSTRDVNEACLLPPVLYTSEEFFAFEKDAIFGHDWLCVGRADQVPEPG